MKTQTVIISFDSPTRAEEGEAVMKAADPSQRSQRARATVFVTWHANIFASAQALTDAGFAYTLTMGDDVL